MTIDFEFLYKAFKDTNQTVEQLDKTAMRLCNDFHNEVYFPVYPMSDLYKFDYWFITAAGKHYTIDSVLSIFHSYRFNIEHDYFFINSENEFHSRDAKHMRDLLLNWIADIVLRNCPRDYKKYLGVEK